MYKNEQYLKIGNMVYKYEYIQYNGIWSNEPICTGKMTYEKYKTIFGE